ncbi:MAG: 1-(5-phosphoribosyl)-5-[(5-phosphoribosylamino)methylideneamino]imidazole-4-carboxamide isomerase [bacterium]
MLVIPAIDIKERRCVRLRQGVFSQQTIYSDDPVEVASSFQSLGARRLHIVDLDGAQTGRTQNTSVVEKMFPKIKIPIQLGGGIRSLEAIEAWLTVGVDRVVIGTLAVKRPEIFKMCIKEFGSHRIILAVDARNGMVAVDGWQKTTGVSAIELATKFKEFGLERILYTDILRDGMFSGLNLPAIKNVAVETGLRVIASGGVSSKQDLNALRKLQPFGVDSVVVGRALYEGRIAPQEVL